ncbi:hypothetical protein S40288_00589 [Stachybotrys chartarum IBT 40288]|nr:hypothetical protein S40288_00589 [Stachybotrys chartarum IBT 40288]
MVMTHMKRAKRILRWLSALQQVDDSLAPSAIPLIRYNLLYNYYRCTQAAVHLQDPKDHQPTTLSFHAMPKFLKSQLEAQKITDGSSLWAQVYPILTFIKAKFRKLDESRGFPTLFYYYSPENHRSYLFFAFIEIKMISQTYSSRDLLRMRHLPGQREMYERLYEKLNRDHDLGDVVRPPPDRALPLIREEAKEVSEESVDNPGARQASVRQLDGTDYDWKYRGRNDSEHAETQPINAPCTLGAQKDEGFQRFYKAVVSPTHVRVTAGGRIVPNERGSSSPTSKWTKEKIVAEGVTQPSSCDAQEPNGFPVAQPPYGPYAHVFPGFMPGLPGIPAMSAAPSPFPMMHWPMGYNMPGGYGMPPYPPAAAPIANVAMSSTVGFAPPAKPPISSIRPSEITRKQLDMLRGSLKYIEDQLLYNKHQIDERGMESQAQMLRQQIEHFQKTCDLQMEFERVHYPGPERKNESMSSSSSPAETPSKSSVTSEPACEQSAQQVKPVLPDDSSQHQSGKSRSNKNKSTARQSTGTSIGKATPALSVSRFAAETSSESEPLKRTSTLPFTAALAPPFQPRADGNSYAYVVAPADVEISTSHFNDGSVESNAYRKSQKGSSDMAISGQPYLVGQIPLGINRGSIIDTGYTYTRELTEDELRARHMYWGKAPRHLQKGLPKFDGKDFYPPSPVKASSSEAYSTTSLPSRKYPTEHDEVSCPTTTSAADTDPFQFLALPGPRVTRNVEGNVTQSESLAKNEGSTDESLVVNIQRTESCITPVGQNYAKFCQSIGSSMQPGLSGGSKNLSSSDEGEDDKSLLFKGRRALGRNGTKTHNNIWQSVLKKGKTSSNLAPGTVSSMTAQGVLPHYSGHATASLTPTIANTAASTRGTTVKHSDMGNEGVTNIVVDRKRENLPPIDVNRANAFRKNGCADAIRRV